jgi:hypothetical protein
MTEVLDKDILNLIADWDEQVMRDTMEEETFERAIRHWETDGVMEDIFGG